MKYFLDTEFIDEGTIIDLISIGIVAEDGRELYLQFVELDPRKASEWVQDNVFPNLSVCHHVTRPDFEDVPKLSPILRAHAMGQCTFSDPDRGIIGAHSDCPWRSRNQIAHELFTFLDVKAHGTPELWGWCAAYDFVALCQIFGTMLDLPAGWPHYIRELQYLLDERGIADSELPKVEGVAHNALADAKQIRAIWEFVIKKGK